MGSIKKLKKLKGNSDKAKELDVADQIIVTEEILNKDQAIDQKTNQLQTKILGMATTKFEIESIEKVHVPYCFYIYDYKINRKTFVNRSGKLDKSGQVAIVFDLNEVHPFEYDLKDEDRLEFAQASKSDIKGRIMKAQCSKNEADDMVIARIQNKILRRLYATTGDLDLIKRKEFYRPAWALAIRYKGSENVNMRYAYADNYAVQNEHILGLKFRLDGR